MAFTVGKVVKKLGLFWQFSRNCPKKKIAQWAKIRRLWSPWFQRFPVSDAFLNSNEGI
jgi:hypothetical protein